MKVKDLILKLCDFNKEARVVITNEDDEVMEISGYIYNIKGQLRIVIK